MKKYKKIPHVGSVMTPFPHFADTDAGVADVERLMDEHHIRHIPVQQDGRVVGIVSERDLHYLVDGFLPKNQTQFASEPATLWLILMSLPSIRLSTKSLLRWPNVISDPP